MRLKPQNIVLSDISGNGLLEDLKVKLVDFGISRDQSEEEDQLSEMGTSLYNSPEQIRGEVLDYSSDIYSYGVTAFELLTGNVPFNAGGRLAVTDSHLVGKVPRVDQRNRQVSSTLDRMIRVCMKKERESRYSSIDEVISRCLRRERHPWESLMFKRMTAPLLSFLTR